MNNIRGYVRFFLVILKTFLIVTVVESKMLFISLGLSQVQTLINFMPGQVRREKMEGRRSLKDH